MKCPVCEERLRPVERFGVEIDICPGCKGVWLDRGELDKILQMAATDQSTAPSTPPTRPEYRERYDNRPRRDDDDDDYDYDRSYGRRRRRRGHWLSDLFDNIGD